MSWLQQLERDGFAIVRDLVSDAALSELVRAIEGLGRGSAGLERRGSVYAMRNLLREVPATRRLADSEPVRNLLERVLGPGAFVVRGLLFDKTAEANWVVPWHQDLTIAVKARIDAPGYGPWTKKAGVLHVRPPVSVLERMLTIRVQLDDGHERNGPLRVLPGSHSRGRLGAEATRDWLERVSAQPCLVPRGGALLMRPLLLHASSPALAPDHRRVVHLEFAADPLPGGVEWFETEEPPR